MKKPGSGRKWVSVVLKFFIICAFPRNQSPPASATVATTRFPVAAMQPFTIHALLLYTYYCAALATTRFQSHPLQPLSTHAFSERDIAMGGCLHLYTSYTHL